MSATDADTLQPIDCARRAWLIAHLTQTRLDMVDLARFPFRAEAQRLFGLTPDLRPLESYDPVLARIEALVSGDGQLSERVEAFRNRYMIPADRINAVMDAAIAECRRRISRTHHVRADAARRSRKMKRAEGCPSALPFKRR